MSNEEGGNRVHLIWRTILSSLIPFFHPAGSWAVLNLVLGLCFSIAKEPAYQSCRPEELVPARDQLNVTPEERNCLCQCLLAFGAACLHLLLGAGVEGTTKWRSAFLKHSSIVHFWLHSRQINDSENIKAKQHWSKEEMSCRLAVWFLDEKAGGR